MWLCWGPLAMEEKEGVLMDIAEKQQCLLSLSLSLCHTHTHTRMLQRTRLWQIIPRIPSLNFRVDALCKLQIT